jgi:hypothetical protein
MKSTVQAMDPAELVDRIADERLLAEDAANLPAAVGRPEPLPEPSAARARIVGLGATLTGVTLLVGIALIAAGIGEAVSNAVALGVAALVAGLALVGTHWGWVHVAEVTGQAVERRHNRPALDRRQRWLEQIKPYTRYEVTTSVDEDGGIRIVRARHDPVATGERRFTFTRTVEHEEAHTADEPGATVAERAELLRRRAAADTERERRRFEVALDAYETALLNADDEQQRQAARRAASQALSEQINANLREPPLVE